MPFVQDGSKTYRFTVAWGVATTTLDREGAVTATSDHRPSVAEVEAALPALTGAISQVPPAYSAIRVDGERAYDLARAGAPPELEPRTVHVHRLRIAEALDADHLVLEADCGKGVYVRALARDLAAALDTQAHVAALRRTRVGPFTDAEAIPLEFLLDLGYERAALEGLLPVETALDDIPALAVTAEDAFRLSQGRSIVPPSPAGRSAAFGSRPRRRSEGRPHRLRHGGIEDRRPGRAQGRPGRTRPRLQPLAPEKETRCRSRPSASTSS